MNLTLQQLQVLDSIKEFMESDVSVFILHGYAGTGKTTMVKHIAGYIAQSRNVKLMAPTGRAARVLEEKTGYSATTIHKAIYSTGGMVAKEVKDVAELDSVRNKLLNISDVISSRRGQN